MNVSPIFRCPACRKKGFVISASSETYAVGSCLICEHTRNVPIFPAGEMNPGDPAAQELGFFPELFDGYLWVENHPRRILVSYISSKRPRQGNFKNLCASIEAHGYDVAVPSPFPLMVYIMKRFGFVPHPEYNDLAGEDIEVWTRPGEE